MFNMSENFFVMYLQNVHRISKNVMHVYENVHLVLKEVYWYLKKKRKRKNKDEKKKPEENYRENT